MGFYICLKCGELENLYETGQTWELEQHKDEVSGEIVQNVGDYIDSDGFTCCKKDGQVATQVDDDRLWPGTEAEKRILIMRLREGMSGENVILAELEMVRNGVALDRL